MSETALGSGEGLRAQGVTISRGIAPALCHDAAELYWQAFGAKLGRVLGPRVRGIAFVERVLSPTHAFSATDAQGTLLGVIGFRTANGSFVGGSMADLRAVYGRAGGGWRAMALGLLAEDLAPGTIAVDGLVVAEPFRGQGIGRALLSQLMTRAGAEGYATLHLDVVGQNIRARQLYERLGFRTLRHVKSPFTAAVFGFRSRYSMDCALTRAIEDRSIEDL